MSGQPPTRNNEDGGGDGKGSNKVNDSGNVDTSGKPLSVQDIATESGPGLMRALVYYKHKKPPKVGLVTLPPNPAQGQLLLRVLAASLNPADYKTADGAQGGKFVAPTRRMSVWRNSDSCSGTELQWHGRWRHPGGRCRGMFVLSCNVSHFSVYCHCHCCIRDCGQQW